jgi:hypothetical protein
MTSKFFHSVRESVHEWKRSTNLDLANDYSMDIDVTLQRRIRDDRDCLVDLNIRVLHHIDLGSGKRGYRAFDLRSSYFPTDDNTVVWVMGGTWSSLYQITGTGPLSTSDLINLAVACAHESSVSGDIESMLAGWDEPPENLPGCTFCGGEGHTATAHDQSEVY